MPIYEYTCGRCRSQFELLIRGEEVPQCPTCGQTELEKRMSVPAAHTSKARQLPICQSPSLGACGLPQCARDGCPMA